MSFETEPLTDFSKPANVELYREALRGASARLGADYSLNIGGKQVETGEWMESRNPAETSGCRQTWACEKRWTGPSTLPGRLTTTGHGRRCRSGQAFSETWQQSCASVDSSWPRG